MQFLEASGELYPMWHYSDAAKLMAVTDHTQVLRQATLALTLALTLTCTLPLAQVLRVLDAKGKLVYRVQLPPEGKTNPDPNPGPTSKPKP